VPREGLACETDVAEYAPWISFAVTEEVLPRTLIHHDVQGTTYSWRETANPNALDDSDARPSEPSL
jgi:hypothetical protein